jgi:hypothetical protein
MNVRKFDAHPCVRLTRRDDAKRGEDCIIVDDLHSDFRAHRKRVSHLDVASHEAQVCGSPFETQMVCGSIISAVAMSEYRGARRRSLAMLNHLGF